MRWVLALLKAGLGGGFVVVAPFAASMAADGYTSAEGRVLLAQFISGFIGGLAGLFVNKPAAKAE